MKYLNFVYDKKSGDLLAPSFVPNHVVAIRNYDALCKGSEDLIFKKYPEDFELFTIPVELVKTGLRVFDDDVRITPFSEIVGDVNGQ